MWVSKEVKTGSIEMFVTVLSHANNCETWAWTGYISVCDSDDDESANKRLKIDQGDDNESVETRKKGQSIFIIGAFYEERVVSEYWISCS